MCNKRVNEWGMDRQEKCERRVGRLEGRAAKGRKCSSAFGIWDDIIMDCKLGMVCWSMDMEMGWKK